MNDSIVLSVETSLSPEQAFIRFTEQMTSWWPSGYTWSGNALEQISIDPRVGGFCTEIGPFGFRVDFGRVLEAAQGERIRFTWQISPRREPLPDPLKAGEVEVSFAATAAGTRVSLTHSHFRRYGDGSDAYREAMGSEQGWPLLLRLFAKVA